MSLNLVIYAAAAAVVLLLSAAGLLILLRSRRGSKPPSGAHQFSRLLGDELADLLPQTVPSPSSGLEADSTDSLVLNRAEVEFLAKVAAHKASKVPRLVVH